MKKAGNLKMFMSIKLYKTTFGGYKKMRELQAIHADRDQVREAIANAGQGTDTSQWQVEEMRYTDELAEAQTYWDNQKAHENRVNDATTEITTRLDTLYLGGQTLRELCADEEAYQILRISFTQDYISQATKNSEVLSQVQTEAQTAIKQANDRANELDNQNSELLQQNNKLSVELNDITSRFKAAELLLSEAPSSEETDRLKQEIADLTAQLKLKAKAEEPKGDAKSQIDAMVEARENRKVKITNLRLADPSGINTKDYLATDVLTGLEISIHSNYVKSYKEVSAEEAEQIRAELEAQNNSIPVQPLQEPDILPVNAVLEEEAPAADNSFQESNQVDADTNNQNTTAEGNRDIHEVVEQESEVNEFVSVAVFNTAFRLVYENIGKLQEKVSELEAKAVA